MNSHILPSFIIDKYQYDENSERQVGINRIWTPFGKYYDLLDDEVKQYLSYELISAPNILRNYGRNTSKPAYEPYTKSA